MIIINILKNAISEKLNLSKKKRRMRIKNRAN